MELDIVKHSEYLGFLAAVCSSPKDDTLRLIFADWLDDHSQPERAEFIRVQCELADWERQREASGKSGWRTLKIRNRVDALRRREIELWPKALFDILDEVREASLIPDAMIIYKDDERLDHMTNKSEAYVSRGFVSEVRLSCQEWLTHGPVIVRRQPIERVVMTDRKPQRFGDGFGWIRYFGEFREDSEPSFLPSQIYVELDIFFTIYVQPGSRTYPTEASALDALSKAALLFARLTEPATASA